MNREKGEVLNVGVADGRLVIVRIESRSFRYKGRISRNAPVAIAARLQSDHTCLSPNTENRTLDDSSDPYAADELIQDQNPLLTLDGQRQA